MQSPQFRTLLAVLGTIFTALAVLTSYFQFRAADLQARAAIVSLMPQVEVRSVYGHDDPDPLTIKCGVHPSLAASGNFGGPPPCYFASESQLRTREHLRFNSDGGPIYNVNIDLKTWFSLRARDSNKFIYRQEIYSYYSNHYKTGRVKGEIYWLLSAKDNIKLYDQFSSLLQDELGYAVYIEPIETMIRLSYSDSFGATNIEYFLLTPSEGIERLELSNGEDNWNSLTKELKSSGFVHIEELEQPEMLKKVVAKIKSKLQLKP